MKYRVKAGIHIEGNRTYNTGDVVTTDRPLDKMFYGKFEQLMVPAPEDDEEEPVPVTAKAREDDQEEPEEAPAPAKKAKRISKRSWD